MAFYAPENLTRAEIRAKASRTIALRRASYVRPKPVARPPAAPPPPVVKLPPPPPKPVEVTPPVSEPAPSAVVDSTPFEMPPPRRIPVRAIMKATADYFGLSLDDLLGPLRAHARARQIGMYLAHELTPLGYPPIGRAMKRDHSTILHGARKIAQLLEAGDAEVTAAVRQIARVLAAAWPVVSLTSEEEDESCPPPRWSEEETQRLIEMRNAKMTPKHVAHELGRSLEAVRNKGCRLGFPFKRAGVP